MSWSSTNIDFNIKKASVIKSLTHDSKHFQNLTNPEAQRIQKCSEFVERPSTSTLEKFGLFATKDNDSHEDAKVNKHTPKWHGVQCALHGERISQVHIPRHVAVAET